MECDLFDALAENAWRLPTADGTTGLHVTEIGEGPPVVCLHGGPGAHVGYLVDAVRRSLDRARFVLVEQRGSLLSPVRPDLVGTITADRLVDDLETLRETWGLERLVLFGHSWGSLLAQLYFLAHPGRVAGLVLTGAVSPYALSESAEVEMQERQEELRRRPEVEEAIRAAALEGDPDRLDPRQAALRYRITGLASFSIYRMENWRRVRSMHWNRDAALAVGRSLPGSYDIRPVLRDHPIPITVIQGDHDYIDPRARRWQEIQHPGIEVTVVPRAGHNAWIDDPSVFDQALRAGLCRCL